MNVINFPSPVLTQDDKEAILAGAAAGGYYVCEWTKDDRGLLSVTLLNLKRQVRGRITKLHGVYTVLDARGAIVLKSRKLADALGLLAK